MSGHRVCSEHLSLSLQCFVILWPWWLTQQLTETVASPVMPQVRQLRGLHVSACGGDRITGAALSDGIPHDPFHQNLRRARRSRGGLVESHLRHHCHCAGPPPSPTPRPPQPDPSQAEPPLWAEPPPPTGWPPWPGIRLSGDSITWCMAGGARPLRWRSVLVILANLFPGCIQLPAEKFSTITATDKHQMHPCLNLDPLSIHLKPSKLHLSMKHHPRKMNETPTDQCDWMGIRRENYIHHSNNDGHFFRLRSACPLWFASKNLSCLIEATETLESLLFSDYMLSWSWGLCILAGLLDILAIALLVLAQRKAEPYWWTAMQGNLGLGNSMDFNLL